MTNPFIHGNPVPHRQFLDRERELRRLVSRIVSGGQSSAVIGEPRSGKTSLLTYLAAPETRQELYGEEAGHIVFAYLDAQTLGAHFGQVQFWEYSLRPLRELAIVPAPESGLAQAYGLCEENQFGAFVLERLLARMRQAGWRLVVLLDEFDVLLHHPTLNRAEFFGSLRSLASRSEGALAVILASRRGLDSLNRETQELSRTGSPFFNIFAEFVLGPWPDAAVEQFLGWGGERFGAADRRVIKALAGGHPYLLQAAASALWDAHDDKGLDARGRWQEMARILYDETAPTLSEMWRSWTPRVRRAFIGVALAHLGALADRAGRVGTERYSVPAIRDLLRAALTDRELRRLCVDRPALGGVVSSFPSGASLEDLIDVLIEHCQKQMLFSELLAGVREVNPRQYECYEANLAAAGLPAGDAVQADLEFLQKQGFIARDEATAGGWRVRPLVLLWWLALELAGATSSPAAQRAWMQAHDLDGCLGAEEEGRLRAAAGLVGPQGAFREGIAGLIRAAAGEWS